MEIFTLVKANIRKKKGSFISIIMLTTLLVAAVVTILGVKENYHAGMKRAFETSDVGAIMAFAQKEKIVMWTIDRVIDELKDKSKLILFIDEIHTLMGTKGEALDFANMLKPGLDRGDIKMIGRHPFFHRVRRILPKADKPQFTVCQIR